MTLTHLPVMVKKEPQVYFTFIIPYSYSDSENRPYMDTPANFKPGKNVLAASVVSMKHNEINDMDETEKE